MSHGRSDVRFTNSYGKKLFVACCVGISAASPIVGRHGTSSVGSTSTREKPRPAPTPTRNQWFHYHAEAVDGAVWAGPFVANVSNNKFQKCSCLGVSVSHGPQPYYDVGMRELDTVKFGGVNFIP